MFPLFIIIGSLGLFMFGMKSLSDGIQKLAGERLRHFLDALTSNRIAGVLTGFGTTTLIQSSTAATVMIVSFVNAGLISLRQAISLIMGSNIGTTIKALIFAYSGTRFNLEFIALGFSAIAFPMLFSRREIFKSTAQFLMGTSMVFISLELLKGSVTYFEDNSYFFDIVQSYSGSGISSITFAFFTAMMLTMIVQSSSAIFALTLILSERGIISFEMAAAMVIGENIGTTITANIAAIVANRNGKRAALSHSMFNMIGALLILPVFYPVLDLLEYFVMELTQKGSPYTHLEARPYAIAFLHVGFNVTTLIVLIGFVPQIERLTQRIIRDKEREEKEFHLEYIHSGIIGTPEIAMLEAKKELIKLARVTVKMSGMIKRSLLIQEKEEFNSLMSHIKKHEEITDRFDKEIVSFLSKIPQNELSIEAAAHLQSMVSISSDLERIGDLYYQMSKVIERKKAEKIYFTPEQRNNLLELFKKLEISFDTMLPGLSSETDPGEYRRSKELHHEIRSLHDAFRIDQHAGIEKGGFHIKSGQIYLDLLAACEKISEHIYQISEVTSQKSV